MRLTLFRIITPLILFFSSSFLCHADEQESVLIIELTGGEKEYFFLSDKPVLTFADDTLYVNTSDFSADIGSVAKFYFDDRTREEVSIKDLSRDNKNILFTYMDGQTVIIQGSVVTSGVRVYDVNGRMVSPDMSAVENEVRVSLSTLPTGIYIIRCNNQSYKIVKK